MRLKITDFKGIRRAEPEYMNIHPPPPQLTLQLHHWVSANIFSLLYMLLVRVQFRDQKVQNLAKN